MKFLIQNYQLLGGTPMEQRKTGCLSSKNKERKKVCVELSRKFSSKLKEENVFRGNKKEINSSSDGERKKGGGG